jgi:hypothetical protein
MECAGASREAKRQLYRAQRKMDDLDTASGEDGKGDISLDQRTLPLNTGKGQRVYGRIMFGKNAAEQGLAVFMPC